MIYNPKVSFKLCKNCIYYTANPYSVLGYCMKVRGKVYGDSLGCSFYDDSDIF